MRLKRLIFLTSTLIILFAGVILLVSEPVFAETGLTLDFVDRSPTLPKTGTRGSSHPSLVEFRSSLSYEHDDRIVGIYAPGSFALPVVQQPTSNPGFVSTKPEVVTQFGLATDYGTIGFLAHNTLSGAHFFDLDLGQTVVLVYGDGSIETFIIRDRLSYQALSPNSPYSRFKDLNSTELEISSTDLFKKVYTDDGQLVFQTCIASDGVENWGRYFVLAVPAGRIPHYGHGLFQIKAPTFH